jgi:hypothetical protein
VNGDGFGDVIVGAPYYDNGSTDEGQAFIYYGGGGGGRALNPREQTPAAVAIQPFHLMATDDQVQLALLANSAVGATRVRLQWQIKSNSDPFDDLSSLAKQTSWYSSMTGGAPATVSETVTATANGRWHWRARILYFGFGWSPWQRFDRTGMWAVDFRTQP